MLVLCAQAGDAVTLTVADRGCGIPPELIPRVTEPFYMVDKSRARRYFYVFNGDFESSRRAELCHIVRKRILRFGYTYGEIAEAEFGKTVYLLFRRRKHGYAVAAVNFFNNGFYLFFYT